MTYRDPSERIEPEDGEALAIAEIGRRAQRTRKIIIVPFLAVGVACSVVLYVLLREWQFAANGAHIPWLTGVLSFTPSFGGSLMLAPRLANSVVALMLPRWRSALAREHGLDEAAFEETTRLV
jgi:hypothetical protein